MNSYSMNAEFWIKVIREGLDRYRLELTNPVVLNAIGPVDGLTVLDAGCGEGYLSRILAKAGATVTGVDACADLIDAARAAAAKDNDLNITYDVSSVEDLYLPDESADVVVANHLLNDLPDIRKPLAEFSRILRASGRLVTLMLHPAFYAGNLERGTNDRFPSPSEYFGLRRIEQEFRVAGIVSPAPATIWLRPFEEYVNSLADAGFVITAITEPHPSPKQLQDPWWRENFSRPLFMQITADKRT